MEEARYTEEHESDLEKPSSESSLHNNSQQENSAGHEPTIAPGMNTNDMLEEKATEREVQEGDATLVTRLYVDRTPED